MSTPNTDTVLETLEKSHPRLMLKDARLRNLRDAIDAGEDRRLGKCYRDLIALTDQVLEEPPLKHGLRDGRLLHVSRECLKRVYALALAWRLTGKRSYADAAVKNLLAVCAFADWNSAHSLDMAEMTHAVAVGYDWLYSALDEAARKEIREGLIRHGLEPSAQAYASREGPRWMNRTLRAFNWNPVCNGGLIIGSLAIAETDPQYAERIVPEAVKALPMALKSYGPDGLWGEGPSYWSYATRYVVYALSALETALGTDFGLAESTGLARTGRAVLLTQGPTGLSLNFADVQEGAGRKPLWQLFWLSRRYNDSLLAAAEHATLERHRASPEHLIWYVPPVEAELPALDVRFRGDVEVACFRSGWGSDQALYVGVKAGYNLVNHGHLDLGHFELDALGVRWALDLGKENYSLPGYWNGREDSGRRWTYFRLSSHGHNVPLLEGENQRVAGSARFVKYHAAANEASVVIDLSSAYAGKARSVLRGVRMLPGRREVLVQDEFDLPNPREITWGTTTAAAITLQDNQALLSHADKALRMTVLSPPGATFSAASAEQRPPQKPNAGVKRLLIKLPRQAGNVRVAVMFSPVWPDGTPGAAPRLQALSDWPNESK